MKRTAIFQYGVDVLGFPLYVEHTIYQDKPRKRNQTPKNCWIVTTQQFLKQF